MFKTFNAQNWADTIKSNWAPLCLCAAFFIYSAVYVLGNYQSMNGDFFQYYLHAQNLLKGRSWDYYIEGKVSVLPGWPFVIAGVQAVFGTSYYIIALLNSLLWALTSWIGYLYFRPRFSTRLLGLAYLAACLFAAFIIDFQQQGQPNIAYGFMFMLSLYAIRAWLDQNRSRFWIFIILLPAFFRTESLVIYTALVIYLIAHKNYKGLAVPMIGTAITIGLDLWITSQFNLISNIIHFSKTSGLDEPLNIWARFTGFTTIYVKSVLALFLTIPELFIGKWVEVENFMSITTKGGPKTSLSLLHLLCSAAFLFSFLKVKSFFTTPRQTDSLFSLDRLFLMGHLAFLSLFFLPVIPVRYFIPLLPIYLFYLMTSLFTITEKLPIPKIAASLLITGMTVLICWHNFKEHSPFPKRKNFVNNIHTVELFNYITETYPDRLIGFHKDRIMSAALSDKGLNSPQALTIRNAKHGAKLFQQDGVLAQLNFVMKDELKDYIAQRGDICPIWKNKNYTIYEIKKDGRICIDL